jgi:hypothetical protein
VQPHAARGFAAVTIPSAHASYRQRIHPPTKEKHAALPVTAIMLRVKDLARSKKFYADLGRLVEHDLPNFVSIGLI